MNNHWDECVKDVNGRGYPGSDTLKHFKNVKICELPSVTLSCIELHEFLGLHELVEL